MTFSCDLIYYLQYFAIIFMKKFFVALFLFFFTFSVIYAEIRVISIIPNPLEWQKEKVEIQNIGCENIDIENFSFQKIDTNKNKIIEAKILKKSEILEIETSNFFKNTWDEFLFLNKEKQEIEKIFYSNAKKWEKINFEYNLQNCENFSNEEKNENPENKDENFLENQENSDENLQNENQDKNNEENQENQDFLYPISINFGDENANNKIDFIELGYDEKIKNSLDLDFSKILISSKQNWLYSEEITNSWIVWSWSIEENFLKIFIKESDFEAKNLEIDLSENSDLIISTTEDFSLFSENSKKIFLFPDEQNWEKMEIFHLFEENENNEKPDEIEIIPIIQNWSDATFENWIFYCTKQNCRLNLDFSKDFPTKNYFCNIYFGENLVKSCNPGSQILKNWDQIRINFIEKSTKNEINKIFDLDFSRIYQNNFSSRNSRNPIKYTTSPIIVVNPQGKFDKEFSWNENEIECFYSTCSIDLTASGSFSYEGANLKYFWKFGPNIEKTGKNPSAVVFEAGEYDILLTVSDNYNSFATHEIKVKVPENKSKIQEKVEKEKLEKSLKNSKNSEKIFEYKEPELILQGRTNISEDEDWLFVCETKTGKCNINFGLQNAQKEMKFYWGWDDEVAFESKNPKSKELDEWEHILIIQWFYEKNLDEILYEKMLVVKVEKIVPEKKKSRIVKKTTKKITKEKIKTNIEEKSEKEIIEPIVEKQENSESNIIFSLAGLCFISACFPLFRWKNEDNLDENQTE